jgi:prolyl-tRNA editing enzyme YbaK/EbsC (Cys-tRNA(Pro) deacylase)
MAIPKKITSYLDKNKFKYEVIEHRTTYTAWDTAQTEKVRPQEVAKTLVMRVDNDYVLALVTSNRNLDKQKLLKVINVSRKKTGLQGYKKIDFAKEAWMTKNIPGKVGATAPFQGLLKLDLYVDSALLKSKKIYVGAGEYTSAIRVNTNQYLKIENPIKGSFSKKK